jgi:hypothetical protein
MKEHPKQKGQKTEATVLARLINKGYTVLEPFGDNERYDYVIEEEGSFERVQVKTGRVEDGKIEFEVRSTGVRTRKVEREDYHGDVDSFITYCPATDEIYKVDISEVGTASFSIRFEEPSNNQYKGINWCENYRVKRV